MCGGVRGDIIGLLEEANSDFTLDNVKDVIYNEKDTSDMQKVIAMFDDGNPENLSNIIETVTDAWNCFSHKALGGRCPKRCFSKIIWS